MSFGRGAHRVGPSIATRAPVPTQRQGHTVRPGVGGR